MKRVHLLQIDDAPAQFEPLVRAITEVGMRVGWLDFRPVVAPEALTSGSEIGIFRAVAVGESSTLSLKSRTGPAVTQDLIREYFRGCSIVLISGGREAASSLRRKGDKWCVVSVEGVERAFTTQELVAALRRVRPFQS